MKTLLFIILALTLVCCSVDPIEYKSTKNNQECGLIVSTGEDQRGDYIEVKTQYEKSRYQVEDYRDYKINTQICNFDGLSKQPL